jgi:hypothetical protein
VGAHVLLPGFIFGAPFLQLSERAICYDGVGEGASLVAVLNPVADVQALEAGDKETACCTQTTICIISN